MRWSAVALHALVTAVLAACGGSEASDDEAAFYECLENEVHDTFVVGLEKTSPSGVRFRLMSAVPAPPTRGDNHFVVHVLDAAGAPLVGAALRVVQFMPAHRHGSPVPVVITESATVLGEYDVNPVNFQMNELWHVYMATSAADADEVMFAFCIP